MIWIINNLLVAALLLQGCAAAVYATSAVGTGHNQYRFIALEKRVDYLETVIHNPPDRDMWSD
jgi:hypothetical protein